MKQLLLLAVAVVSAFGMYAQGDVVTTQPPILQQATSGITLTFHADRGNKGIAGLKPPTKVYAHTGVITNLSSGPGDWKYASSWGDNAPKYELKWVADNTWTLNIPSIDSYYGIPAGETVEKLAFVFRSSTGKEGKTADGGDIFVDVAAAGFQAQLSSDPATDVLTSPGKITLTVNTTAPANIALYIGSVDSQPIARSEGVTSLSATHNFSQSGTYEVIAVATSGSDNARVSLRIAVLGASQQADFPGGVPKMGYTIADNGDVTFCLAAPGKESVIIVPSWDDYAILTSNQMFYQDYNGQRYFWITKSGLDPTKNYIYYYLIDGTRRVGDPYARLVLDPWNDKYISSSVFPDLPAYPVDKVTNVPLAVFNLSQDAYQWQVEDFKGVAPSQLQIYELLLRDFTGTEGQANANGTLAGAMKKLDYLQSLGVNAVELLPIMEFNGNNSWGYNTNFYFAPDKAYGTPDDYRAFIDECHSRGMAVILDIVFNQSDGLHPWYQMYDIAENPFYNGSAPHAYSVLNDWNQDNTLVQQQWADALQYWLTAYKVDGFRFDLVKGLGNNDSYGNTYNPATNTWGTPSDANTNRFNASRVERMRTLHEAMRVVNPDAYFINENLAGAQEENDMAADGELNWANINTSACQFAMGYSSDSGLNRFFAPRDSRTWGSTVSYAESHDEERMAYKQQMYGAAGVKGNSEISLRRLGSVAAQMILSPGAHMIWQFQELGDNQTTKNSTGNDTSPKKVVWNLLNDPLHKNLYYTYCELLALRRDNPAMFDENVSINLAMGSSNWANGRTLTLTKGSSQIILTVNPEVGKSITINPGFLGSPSAYKVLAASKDAAPTIDSNGNVTLAPGAFAVFGTDDMTSISPTLDIQPTPDAPAVYYDLQGREVPTPTSGHIYILRQGSHATKVLIP